MNIIDTHVHFWDVDKFDYPWIESSSLFNRNFSLTDYERATFNIPIKKMVFIECDCNPKNNWEEVGWVKEYANIDTRIKGIVAHVHLTNEKTVDRDLEKMSSEPLIKGIRHNIQYMKRGFAIQDSFVAGIKKIHKKKMHFELCITHDQLEETIELVKRCPEVQFVLNHCAKPGIKFGLKEPWRSQMQRMAEFDNVICKISGLLTEANWHIWTEDEILPYANHAASVFGTLRIMFGSDWPVNEAAGGYGKWYSLMKSLTTNWSESEKENFYYNNANKVYRL